MPYASQALENVHTVYGPDAIAANYPRLPNSNWDENQNICIRHYGEPLIPCRPQSILH